MICWATWSPRPGRELEAKPALTNSLKGRRNAQALEEVQGHHRWCRHRWSRHLRRRLLVLDQPPRRLPAVSATVGNNGHTLTLSTSGALPTTLGDSQNITVSAQNLTHASQILAGLSATLTGSGCTVETAPRTSLSPTTRVA